MSRIPTDASSNESVTLTQWRSRAYGALLGVHVGDALGATVEFCDKHTVARRYPAGLTEIVGGGVFNFRPGAATDDTDLTRAILLAYTQPRDEDIVHSAASYMLDWYSGRWPGRSYPSRPVDVGVATELALSAYAATLDPYTCGAPNGYAGNGSLMRTIPTALFVADDVLRIEHSLALCAITHQDVRASVSCAAYNDMVVALLHGATPSQAVHQGVITAQTLGSTDVVQAILWGANLSLPALRRSPVLPIALRGFVLDSLTLAICALLDPRDFASILSDVVMLGEDADSNAAIAGGLLGAYHSLRAIPQKWLVKLEYLDEFLQTPLPSPPVL